MNLHELGMFCRECVLGEEGRAIKGGALKS